MLMFEAYLDNAEQPNAVWNVKMVTPEGERLNAVYTVGGSREKE